MSKTRKVFLMLVSLVMIFTVTACNGSNNSVAQKTDSTAKKVVVTSFYPMYIFTKNVTKDVPNLEVMNLTEPQIGCLHDYQLSTNDMKMLSKADIFVINGAGMESFMDKVQGQLTSLKIVEASKGMELIPATKGHVHEEHGAQGHEEHGTHGHEEADAHSGEQVKENQTTVKNETSKTQETQANGGELEWNPHVWVGISGAISEVKNIAEQLAALDPQNASQYRTNAGEYVLRIEALKSKMTNALKEVKNRNVVTFHEAFPYFAKEFNLNVVGVIEKDPGEEPTAKELAELMAVVKEKNVGALFTEAQYSPKSAQTIAKETGAKVFEFDLVVTGPKEADPNSYEKAMEKNLELLLAALK